MLRWQSERLSRTHADLLAQQRTRPAVRFFLSDLYAPRDFSRRDRDLERLAPILVRVLPSHVLHTLALALEMNVVTEQLDAGLAEQLAADDALTEPLVAAGIRRVRDYRERRRQIDLIREVGEDLDEIVATPGVYPALRLAAKPAELAGLGELQGLLERGFRAFRHMRGAAGFLGTIVGRELEILGRLENGHPRPFDLGSR